MASTDLPRDPLEAHAVLKARAVQVFEQRREERRKPLPEDSQAEVLLVCSQGTKQLVAEVLDLSSVGMRLAAFVDHCVQVGDRCEIRVLGQQPRTTWATVRWVDPHPLIQVFGVEFDTSLS